MKNRIFLGLLLSCFAIVATAASQWQLNTGFYIPAKMPMKVVFPRPDNEITSKIARQQYAYADGTFQYRIPISIQGGAYPFYVASTSGLPSGMTINSDPNSPDYMMALWTPANGATGSYNCSVVIQDQDGKQVTVTWKVTIDNSKFIFIDPKAGTNGNGTKASPLNTFVGLGVQVGSGTSSYAGKIIVLRGGTTTFVGPETGASSTFVGSRYVGDYVFRSSSTQNPYIFIGYTGENAVLDMNYSGMFRNGGQSDIYFGQLTIKNGVQGKSLDGNENATIFYFDWSGTDRVTFFENTFYNFQYVSTDGSNNTIICIWDPGTTHTYTVVANNTVDNYSVALLNVFHTSYAVVDNNAYTSNGTRIRIPAMLNLKDKVNYFSVRRNSVKASSNSARYGFVQVSNQNNSTAGNDNIEIAYNLILLADAVGEDVSMVVLSDTSQNGNSVIPHVYIYRNTIQGKIAQADTIGVNTYENNVFITNTHFNGTICNYSGVPCTTLTFINDVYPNINTGNLTGTLASGYIDSEGNLTGNAAKYYGRIGHIISNGQAPLSGPTWN